MRAPAHDHGDAAAAQAGAHEHGDDGWSPADGFERTVFSALANIVTGIGFALLLVAASELFGGIKDWRQGLFWGLAGFAVFTLAPGLGLPPELPAMPAAELGARQLWWIGDGALHGASRSACCSIGGRSLRSLPRSPCWSRRI